MMDQIRRATQAVYWWSVRRWNNTKERFGSSSYPELKEFVYLDQTALISLLSSTTGGITQQQTTSKKKRISSSIKSSLGPISASVGSRESESNETVQKYVIQSNFKELYEIRKEDIAISDYVDLRPDVDVAVPKESNIGPLKQKGSPEVQELTRGELVEIDVTLKSSDVYEYFLVFDAFEDIVESFSSEEEFTQQLQQQGVSAEEIAMVLELMEILMAGLIPIECRASNYGVCEREGEKMIVARDWAEEHDISVDDLYLAGFIDEENLWQEPSRVLFSEHEFTAYGRIDNPIPNTEWSPLKLVDILDTVFPEEAGAIENLPSEFEESKQRQSESQNFRGSVRDYLSELESEAEADFSQGTIETVINELDGSLTVKSFEAKENTLQRVEAILEDVLSEDDLNEVGLEKIPQKRANFLEQYTEDLSKPPGEGDSSEKNHLETNFVAIYW